MSEDAVSEDLIALARSVLASYGVIPSAVKVIQAGDVKTVWKIDVQRPPGALCLKRLRPSPEKARFAVGAQKYTFVRGGPVPRLRATVTGDDLAATADGQLFALSDWIDGEPVNLESRDGLRAALHGLARFHRASKGYPAPSESRVSSKLGRWPHHFQSMRQRLIDWKGLAEGDGGDEYLKVYRQEVDHFVSLAQEAQERLASSRYAELADANDQGLCHQDFGPGNALATVKGVVIIDLDGVTFDLAARDLRKIIIKRAFSRGRWSEADIDEVLGFYGEVNPLSPAEKEVLFIDLLFPHEFHDAAKNPFRKQKPAKASDLKRAASLARAKADLLRALIARERQKQKLG